MHRSVKRWCLLLMCFGLFLTAGCSAKTEEKINFEEEKQEVPQKGSEADKDVLYVDVCGQVQHPGVYELPPESRVYQAIEAAGGMTAGAAASGLNQAQKLEDGQQVYVPSGEELQQAAEDQGQQAGAGMQTDDGKVSLNTGTKEELMTLTGIGEVRAEAILRYREDKGRFRSVEELMEIEGIKDGVFQKIKDQIKI